MILSDKLAVCPVLSEKTESYNNGSDKMNKRVLIISSAYMRLNACMQTLPGVAREAAGDGYDVMPGGRGVTAALTFRALGVDSILCSAAGDDMFGQQLYDFLGETGVDRRFVKRFKNSGTGLLLNLNENGRPPRTLRFPEANALISQEDIEAAFMSYPDAVYIQNELPGRLTAFAANLARNKNVPVFWNPCPSPGRRADPPQVRLEAAVLESSDVATYCGVEPDEYSKFLPAALALASRVNAKYYIIRIPDRGAFIYDGLHTEMAGEYPSTYLDEDGAATVYGAALCAAYVKTDGSVQKAAQLAAAAYAYSSSTKGEITSVPAARDIIRFLKKDR